MNFTFLSICLAFGFAVVVVATAPQETAPPKIERKVEPLSYKEGSELHKKTGKPLLVQYGADWCPPCKAQKNLVVGMLKTRDDFLWVYVDVDKAGPLPTITSIPYMAIQVKGKWVHKESGYLSETVLLRKLGLKK